MGWQFFGIKKAGQNPEGKIVMAPEQKEVGQTKERVPSPPAYLKPVGTVIWDLESWQVPNETEMLKITGIEVSGEKLNEIASKINPQLNETSKDETGNLIMKSPDDRSWWYWDAKTRKVSYGVLIESQGDIEKGGEMTGDEAWRQLTSTLRDWGVIPEGVSLEKERTIYQKFVYPIWEEANQLEAEAVEVRGRYVINKIPIEIYEGETIRAIYTRTGKLIKLEFYLPENISGGVKIQKTWNKDELVDLPKESFRIYKVDINGVEGEVGSLDNIGTVRVRLAKLVYIYNSEKRDYLYPYILLEGNGVIGGRPVKVSLITGAIREK